MYLICNSIENIEMILGKQLSVVKLWMNVFFTSQLNNNKEHLYFCSDWGRAIGYDRRTELNRGVTHRRSSLEKFFSVFSLSRCDGNNETYPFLFFSNLSPVEMYDPSATYILVMARENARIPTMNWKKIIATSTMMLIRAIWVVPVALLVSIKFPKTRSVRIIVFKP